MILCEIDRAKMLRMSPARYDHLSIGMYEVIIALIYKIVTVAIQFGYRANYRQTHCQS